MENLQALEWCACTEILEDILKNPKVKLPQLIKLASELIFLDSKIPSIKGEQILNILAKRTLSYIRGTDSKGKDISIPLSCPYAMKLKVPQNDEKFFASLLDIINTDPLPKFVEVTHVENVHEQCSIGEILKILLVEKSGNVSSFVHFRKSTGTHFKIDVNEKMSFQLASNYSTNIYASNLFEKSRELPILAQFSSQTQKDIPKSYLDLGTVTITSDAVSSLDYVITSTDVSGTEYAVIFPLCLDFQYEINSKLKLANDKVYRDLCTSYSKLSIDDVYYYLDQMVVYKQSGNNMIIKNKKLQKQIRNKADVISKTVPTNEQNGNQGTSDKGLKSYQKPIEKGNAKSVKLKANESMKREKKEKKEKEEKKKKVPKVNPDNIDASQYVAPNEAMVTDKQWASIIRKGVKKVCSRTVSIAHKSKATKSSESDSLNQQESIEQSASLYGNEYEALENLYCELPYESLNAVYSQMPMYDSGYEEADHAKGNARHSPMPPPLPGNHPHQAKINMNVQEDLYLDAVDTIKNMEISSDRKSDISQQSLEEVSALGMEDVGNCLTNLNLGKYKKLFEDSLIDGKLLLDLDESVLKVLGLNSFEAIKLRKFVFGWRPGDKQPEGYPIRRGFSSLDPSDWSITDVASHMSGIDVPEMATFCRENQVDGELLKDICIDETIMNPIFPGHDRKLKIVKIRNYVIDQWRPKKKCSVNTRPVSTVLTEELYLAPVVENIVNSPSKMNKLNVSEEKKDAPRIARVKQQLEKKANTWESRRKVL